MLFWKDGKRRQKGIFSVFLMTAMHGSESKEVFVGDHRSLLLRILSHKSSSSLPRKRNVLTHEIERETCIDLNELVVREVTV